jgi:cytochrome c oxidase subunit 2
MNRRCCQSAICLAAVAAAALAGCDGVQSSLAPQGPEAERVARLSAVLFIGAGVIVALVALLAAVALFGPERWRRALRGQAMVVGGGVAFPIVTLTILLAYGLLVMRGGSPEAHAGSAAAEPLRLSIVGEQWWWRVIYESGDGGSFETANELRIPVGRLVQIDLTTADVIHSFWVPRLAGKVDMIPGRTNRIHLLADEPGASRGQCAEYCGGAHALMSFDVVAMTAPDFARWLEGVSGPARVPADEEERRGQALFLASGCGGCHAIRGSEARGTIGPDLTHVGGRLTIAAATLPANLAAFARWIDDHQRIRPENRMPPFDFFQEDELLALATYLESLQ